MKCFRFIVLCLLFSCASKEEPVPYVLIDSAKVYLNTKPDSVFIKNFSSGDSISEITCPKCGFKKKETMPTEVCLIKYTCTKCKTDLHPKDGDCCVFCTYGTQKCPSKQ